MTMNLPQLRPILIWKTSSVDHYLLGLRVTRYLMYVDIMSNF